MLSSTFSVIHSESSRLECWRLFHQGFFHVWAVIYVLITHSRYTLWCLPLAVLGLLSCIAVWILINDSHFIDAHHTLLDQDLKVIEFVGEVYKRSLVWDRLPVRACPWKSHNLLIHWDLCKHPSVRRIWVTWDSFRQKFFLLLSWVCSIFLPMCINFKHATYPCACLDSQLHVGWQTHVKHMEYCLYCFGWYHCC